MDTFASGGAFAQVTYKVVGIYFGQAAGAYHAVVRLRVNSAVIELTCRQGEGVLDVGLDARQVSRCVARAMPRAPGTSAYKHSQRARQSIEQMRPWLMRELFSDRGQMDLGKCLRLLDESHQLKADGQVFEAASKFQEAQAAVSAISRADLSFSTWA